MVDSETAGGVAGWIVGLAAAGFTVWYLFGGGVGLPAGRYPIILLALLFLGPPIIIGGVTGGLAFLIVHVSIDKLQEGHERAKSERRTAAIEQLAGRIRDVKPSDAARWIEQELLPAMKGLGRNLDDRFASNDRTAFHIAAGADNVAFIEELAARGPTYLARSDDGRLFFDLGSDDRRDRSLAAFTRGYTRFLEKNLNPADLPLSDDERALLAKWIADLIEQSKPSKHPTFDLAAFKRDKLSEARAKRAGQAYDDGRLTDAIEPVNSAIRLDPNYPQAFWVRGLAYSALGKQDNAIRDFSEAVRLKPDYPQAFYRRALAHEAKEAWDQAKADYDEAIRLDPNNVTPLIDRGALSFNKRNDINGATADFKRALELAPDNPTARKNLDVAYGTQNADDATIASLTEAIAQNPQDPDALARRGRAYFIRGDTSRAMTDLNEALRIAPENTLALDNRARLFLRKNDLLAALADYTEFARLDPNSAAGHYNIGWVNDNLGRKEEAIAGYRKALELGPGEPDAIRNLKRLGVEVS